MDLAAVLVSLQEFEATGVREKVERAEVTEVEVRVEEVVLVP